MKTQDTYHAPTPAEIDAFIADAHELRRKYIAQMAKAGVTKIKTLLGHGTRRGQATA